MSLRATICAAVLLVPGCDKEADTNAGLDADQTFILDGAKRGLAEAQARLDADRDPMIACAKAQSYGKKLAGLDHAEAKETAQKVVMSCGRDLPVAWIEHNLAVMAEARAAEPKKAFTTQCAHSKTALKKVDAAYATDPAVVEVKNRLGAYCKLG